MGISCGAEQDDFTHSRHQVLLHYNARLFTNLIPLSQICHNLWVKCCLLLEL